MELGPFYTGQVPREPLTIIVRDALTERPVDLTQYNEVAVVIVDPSDEVVPNGAEQEWVGEIANPAAGEVRIPIETSPFTTPGDYELQVVLRDAGNAQDITSTTTFEVYQKLGA